MGEYFGANQVFYCYYPPIDVQPVHGYNAFDVPPHSPQASHQHVETSPSYLAALLEVKAMILEARINELKSLEKRCECSFCDKTERCETKSVECSDVSLDHKLSELPSPDLVVVEEHATSEEEDVVVSENEYALVSESLQAVRFQRSSEIPKLEEGFVEDNTTPNPTISEAPQHLDPTGVIFGIKYLLASDVDDFFNLLRRALNVPFDPGGI